MSLSIERVYLELRDLQKAHDELRQRHDAMEFFIKDKFPGDFAGDVGTVVDTELKPVEINYGPAQERYNETTKTWERWNGETGHWERK